MNLRIDLHVSHLWTFSQMQDLNLRRRNNVQSRHMNVLKLKWSTGTVQEDRKVHNTQHDKMVVKSLKNIYYLQVYLETKKECLYYNSTINY